MLAKVWTFIVVAYALSPIDLIPDFIPILGYLDDLILVPLGILIAVKLIPPKVMHECREQATQSEYETIMGRYAGWVIIVLWLLIALMIGVWLLD